MTTHPAYGCVYSGSHSDDPQLKKYDYNINYISELAPRQSSGSEEKIGNKIKTIPEYRFFFAPIEFQEPVHNFIKQGTRSGLEGEGSSKNKKTEFISKRIRRVGSITVGEYLQTVQSNPMRYIERMIDIYMHAIEGFEQLQKISVVLGENTLIMDEKYGVPIFTGFTESIDVSELSLPDLPSFNAAFSKGGQCVESHLLSFIVNQIGDDNIVPYVQLHAEVSDFVADNYAYKKSTGMITEKQRHLFESAVHAYLDAEESRTDGDGSKLAFMRRLLVCTAFSWDKRAVSILFLSYLLRFLSNNNRNSELLLKRPVRNFKKYLQTAIYVFPCSKNTMSSTKSLPPNVRQL